MERYKILVADDDETIRRLVTFLLKTFDLEIYEAGDGKEAMKIIEKNRPDILVIDVNMPYITGFEICKKIKEDKDKEFIYVIILTGSSVSPEDRERGFDYGADDYICKPFHNKEFLGRIKAALRIKKLHDEVFRLSITDELTGLYNRRYFEQLAANEFYRAERYHRPVSCLLVDIDHFKKINDTYGHEPGDFVLKEMSRILKRARQSDQVCRWGGEEFIILLPGTGSEGAYKFAEHLRETVEKEVFQYQDKKINLTVSIGFTSLSEGPVEKPEDLVSFADKALYYAKQSGRNCVRQVLNNG